MGTYTYTSRPRALPCQRRRYRDSLKQPAEEPIHYGNIMYDRRVIRGNTYAIQTGPLFSSQLFNNLPKNSMLRLPVPDKQEFANSPSKNRKILEV